ncbi:MAG: hypothetical protein AAF337_08640 [Pseudomonadota bacterium]
MSEEIETILYSQVAQDLVLRFGENAMAIAEEARQSLEALGDSSGEEIWSHITQTLGDMEAGRISLAMH